MLYEYRVLVRRKGREEERVYTAERPLAVREVFRLAGAEAMTVEEIVREPEVGNAGIVRVRPTGPAARLTRT